MSECQWGGNASTGNNNLKTLNLIFKNCAILFVKITITSKNTKRFKTAGITIISKKLKGNTASDISYYTDI